MQHKDSDSVYKGSHYYQIWLKLLSKNPYRLESSQFNRVMLIFKARLCRIRP